nr:MAG TPA: hypothetical protein [Caudoviricetes sp.]
MVLRLCGLLVGLLISLPSMVRMIRIFVVWIGLGRCLRFLVMYLPVMSSTWVVWIS